MADELAQGYMPERTVRAACFIVRLPGFVEDLCLGERGELMYVHVLVASRLLNDLIQAFPTVSLVK